MTNPTPTDWRALCAELMDAIDSGIPAERIKQSPLAVRVDAALAQPEPKLLYRYCPVTIAECGGPCEQGPEYCDCGEIKGEPAPQPEPQGPTVMQILALSDEIEAEELGTIDLVRRALARWGRPAIEPDGPAVPDGREPASVTDQPTDKELLKLMPETITPPPELVQQWRSEWIHNAQGDLDELGFLATRAARWGADQELLACGNYLKQCAAWEEEDVTEFYNYRRPRSLSLKELALESVKRFEKSGEFFSDQMRELEFIRKALETIND